MVLMKPTIIYFQFFGIFIVVYLIGKSNNNLYLLGIWNFDSDYIPIVLFDNLSFNQLQWRRRLSISTANSILQFEQVKSYGEFFRGTQI